MSRAFILNAYLVVFMIYVLSPVGVLAAAAFNASTFPSVLPWEGFTLRWFEKLLSDARMGKAIVTSLIVAFIVVIASTILGTVAALIISTLKGRGRKFFYAIFLTPMVIPNIIVGVSTLIFWTGLGVAPGVAMIVISQVFFVSSIVMLVALASLERIDPGLEEAARDLGASHLFILRRVLLPHLKPAIIAGAGLSFFQSLEIYTATLFVKGFDNTLTVAIASRVRTGLDPSINAIAVCVIIVTLVTACAYEAAARREEQARKRT